MYDQQASRPVTTREAEREERRRRKESEKEIAKEERRREKDERRAKEKQRAEASALEAKQRAEQQAAAKAVKSTKVERERERPPSRREEKQVRGTFVYIRTFYTDCCFFLLNPWPLLICPDLILLLLRRRPFQPQTKRL